MPHISELPFDSSYISLSPERSAKRSPGIHLTRILKDMLATANVARNQGKSIDEVRQHMLFETGFLYERLISDYLESDENKTIEYDRWVKTGLHQLTEDTVNLSKGNVVRPGECCMDGIYLTPDATNLRLWFVEEWKATALRPGFSIAEKRIEWIWQIAAYCRYFHMTKAVLRVWHYCSFPPIPPKQYVLEYTTDEIEQNWKNILDHYEYMKAKGRI